MKRFSQFVCLILIVAIYLTTPALTAGNVDQRASSYFGKGSVYLWKVSSTQFQVWFDVTAVNTMDELGASKITVERSTDEVNWESMKTYTKEDYSQMIAKNTFMHSDCVTYTYTSGYYYRAVVTLYAKNSSGYALSTHVTPTLDLR